eukprot:CAMPEP_0116136950 /NCGR_PEP_ID=MMETSP0329-20121206/12002_1 /TAXON_ID=697910 /ORGANISM="Pseudo-nitzschia arenysensis, Strain B593" /LENGTH=488 /DNA_ID=CAMNT_0003631861 /DNA_START=51 /DNA_END=1517 /DNA_ORIENTATION=+
MKQSYKRKNYPKKALTAYNIFFKETREKILIEHGKTNFQEMVRKIAALWKEITYAEKVRFETVAARDLARYKDEVKEYEQRIVEESEANKRQKTIQNYVLDPTSGAIDLQKHRENPRDTHSMHNTSILNATRGNIVAGMGQRMPDRSNANPTLTSDELELALRGQLIDQSRLDIVGRRLSNASVGSNVAQRRNSLNPADVHLYRCNSLGSNFLGADRTNRTGDAVVGDRIALGLHRLGGGIPTAMKKDPNMNIAVSSEFNKRLGFHRGGLSINNGIESVEKYARGVDPMTASNSGKGPMSTFKEEEVQTLVHEAKMRFGSTAIRVDRDNIMTPPLTASNNATLGAPSDSIRNESELRRRLSLRNQTTAGSNEFQMRNKLMLNELNSGVRGASNEDRMMLQRMMAGGDLGTNEMELRRRMSMESVRNQSMSRNPELQMRLAMTNDQQLVEEKLGNTLEEIRLREDRVSRREQMINQWLSGIPWNRAFNA